MTNLLSSTVLRWLSGGAMACLGAITVAVVQRHPQGAGPGASMPSAALLLAAGWSVTTVGLVSWARRPGQHSGPLLVATGGAWFVTEWTNPASDSAWLFSAGLLLWAVGPVLVAQVALALPRGQVSRPGEVWALALGYASTLMVLGLVPTLWFSPINQGCSQCPANVMAVADSGRVVDAAGGMGLWLGVVWPLVLAAAIASTLLRMAPAARHAAGVVCGAGIAYLLLTEWHYLEAARLAPPTSTGWQHGRWVAQGVVLITMAGGAVWAGSAARRAGNRVARQVVALALAPAPGGLRDALAASLGDPSLVLGYTLADGRLVDLHGEAVAPVGARTPLVRGSQTVAVLAHRRGVLDDPTIAAEVTRAARLVLDNERLQAELSVQLMQLRASRQRIVRAADAERRRLERDLHDGAQQRLVTALLGVRLARLGFERQQDLRAVAEADAVEHELAAAVVELRAVAHGVFPSVLVDEGLGPAVEAWVEDVDIEVQMLDVQVGPRHRAAESAAYFLLVESVRRSRATAASVSLRYRAGLLHLDVGLDGGCDHDSWCRDLEDRAGAVDGRVLVLPTSGSRLTLRAVIPCGS